jgi:hypothetical protein
MLLNQLDQNPNLRYICRKTIILHEKTNLKIYEGDAKNYHSMYIFSLL